MAAPPGPTFITEFPAGDLIEAFNSGERRCESWIQLPGTPIWATGGTGGFLYLMALLYCFLGVAIIADMFMGAIEIITSKEKTVTAVDGDGNQKTYAVKVWNPTVANLSLMALGSSAPEILLSVFETVTTLDSKPGKLGPSTIVGSAAFNLMVIVGVCVMVIPKGQSRRIAQIGVYSVTAFSSIWAYIWLLLILQWSSEDQVSIGEAFLTFIQFPLLLLLAWAQDNAWWRKSEGEREERAAYLISMGGEVTEKVMEKELEAIKTQEHTNGMCTESQVIHHIAKLQRGGRSSALYHRVNAIRSLTGRRRILPPMKLEPTDAVERFRISGASAVAGEEGIKCPVKFSASKFVVKENQAEVVALVRRTGSYLPQARIAYSTKDGSAHAGADFEDTMGELEFAEGERAKTISVPLIDDRVQESDEYFTIELVTNDDVSILEEPSVATVKIIDDDLPGILSFEKKEYLVEADGHKITVTVDRHEGTCGDIAVDIETEEDSAAANIDFVSQKQTLTFRDGEYEKKFNVPILGSTGNHCTFKVYLSNPTGGADLGQISVTTVHIHEKDQDHGLVNRLMGKASQFMNVSALETSDWKQQISEAMTLSGPLDENGNDLPPTTRDYVLHFLSFGWKCIFALVPPNKYGGGWPAFFVSLSFIGILTAIIGEVASLFGCAVGLDDSITAITFVALGTSLPDLFASMSAAIDVPTADDSVGNVTGSNSVNVFLGLGLPYVIAACYKDSKGEVYVVPAGDLAFGVSIFAALAAATILLLALRRSLSVFGRAELGGNIALKYVSGCSMIVMWIIYVILSSLKTEGHI